MLSVTETLQFLLYLVNLQSLTLKMVHGSRKLGNLLEHAQRRPSGRINCLKYPDNHSERNTLQPRQVPLSHTQKLSSLLDLCVSLSHTPKELCQ